MTTCLLASLGLPTAAVAGPPDHAPAHGHSDRDGRATGPPATSADDTGEPRGRGGKGNGHGREGAPGQRKKADDGPSRDGAAAPDSVDPDEAAPATPPPSPTPEASPDRPSSPEPADQPAPDADSQEPSSPTAPATSGGAPPTAPGASDGAAPDPATPTVAGPSATAPATPASGEPATTASQEPVTAAAPDVEPGVVGAPPGRPVWRPDLGGPFDEVLQGVDRGVHRLDRLVPRDLGPAAEPLARLVPLLLAILGAFLALQRGIGRGLGHVPMVTTAAPRDPIRRG